MRLIDAGALMEALRDERSYIMNDPEIDTATRFYGVAMLRSFGSMVAKQPTIEAEPVVHGRWVESKCLDECFWVCSNCKFPSEALAAPTLYHYCPNCGAKMGGERKCDG
jgi:rubrerythrin